MGLEVWLIVPTKVRSKSLCLSLVSRRGKCPEKMLSQIIIRLGRVPRAVGSTSTSIIKRMRPLHLLDCAGLALVPFLGVKKNVSCRPPSAGRYS
jgi:hypothetical protein